MTPDLYLQNAASASARRAAGLRGQIDTGETLRQAIIDAQMSGHPTKVLLPSSVLMKRDLTAATASAGGYLLGAKLQPFAELIERESILSSAGATILTGLDQPVLVPFAKNLQTVTWIPAEGTAITSSTPTFGQVALSPKYASTYGVASRQLLLQAVAAERLLTLLSSEAIARGIDAAIIAGTGASGQPTGIVNTAGITTQSGTSLAAAGLRAMRKAIVLAGAKESNILWIGAADVQETLSGRELTSGGGRLLWDADGILGRPAIASSLVPAGTLVAGDFSRLIVTIFDGQGIELSLDPYSDFRSGLVGFRLMFPVDFAALTPAAFAVSTSIT